MANILLRSTNQFVRLPKIIVQNEKKKMTNFIIQQYFKALFYSERVLTITSEIVHITRRKQIINEKIAAVSKNMQRNLLKKEDIASIINQIDSAYIINSYQVISLLTWCNEVCNCLPSEKIELGKSLWSVLMALDCNLNTNHYDALLTLYVQNEKDFSPIKFILDMENAGLKPTEKTYYKCLEYYCMKGNINETITVLRTMQRIQIPITESIFNLLLMSYAQTGNVKCILIILKEMKMTLSAERYAIIMCAYAVLNDINKIAEIIHICHLKNICFINNYILNLIYMIEKYSKDSKNICDTNIIKPEISLLCRHLIKKHHISTEEKRILLKLVSINKINIIAIILEHLKIDKNNPQFKEFSNLILRKVAAKDMRAAEIEKFSDFFDNNFTFKNSMLSVLYYKLMKNDSESLPFLRICRHHCKIKPHYFWPLLIKQAQKYDLQGMINIIKIMIHEFEVLPCIDTLSDYLLPFCFGRTITTRNVLIEQGINISILNNAYLLFYLKKYWLQEAAVYITQFSGHYFYKVLAHDLRCASIYKNDVKSFLLISQCLKEDMDSDLSNASSEPQSVPMDKQLYDLQIDFPTHKKWLNMVLQYAKNCNTFKYEEKLAINKFISEI